MSKLRFLRMWLHEIFGMHNFGLINHKRSTGYHARCACGAFLKRWK